MPRFLTGDELGNIKSVSYPSNFKPNTDAKAPSVVSPVTLLDGTQSDGRRGIQALAAASSRIESGTVLIVAARSDGSALLANLNDGSLRITKEWKETRFKQGTHYVGLALNDRDVYTCTSNGALFCTTQLSKSQDAPKSALLPMRLRDWKLSPVSDSFAYGGDEVEVSLWDAERAFVAPVPPLKDSDPAESGSKKRKRANAELLPAEVWRAKNVPNDFLSLRQPVHVTSLTYLGTPTSPGQAHLLAGTLHGHVRRYDTRAARRPVANWTGVAKAGGIKTVERGMSEHEVFVADDGSGLFAMDTRNGRVIYSYKGIAGAVSSVACSPGYLASVGQDRLFRYHSTHPPPNEAGERQENKGEVLDKVYLKGMPTKVIWDGSEDSPTGQDEDGEESDGEGDVWEDMESVDGDD